MNPIIRQATVKDVPVISSILTEAATWLNGSGKTMWDTKEVTEEKILKDADLFFIAYLGDQAAGTLKFQIEDKLFWPDVPGDDSAFVHRLAVRRCFAGQGISTSMLSWAISRASSLEKRFLRLDCAAARPRLRKIYEDFGFTHHSDRQVGPYLVARYEYETKKSNHAVEPRGLQPLAHG